MSEIVSEVMRLIPGLTRKSDIVLILGALNARLNDPSFEGGGRSGRNPRRPRPKGPKPNIIPSALKETDEYIAYKECSLKMNEYLKTAGKKLNSFAGDYSENKSVPDEIASFYKARECWFRRKAQFENAQETLPEEKEEKDR
jgi:hypothetical protein